MTDEIVSSVICHTRGDSEDSEQVETTHAVGKAMTYSSRVDRQRCNSGFELPHRTRQIPKPGRSGVSHSQDRVTFEFPMIDYATKLVLINLAKHHIVLAPSIMMLRALIYLVDI